MEGNHADVLVINPKEIQDQATFEDPYQYSKGISNVLVNGQVVLENGAHTGARNGEVIRRKSSFFGF